MARRLVLFDFDGTLTKKDTLFEFIRFYHGTPRFLFGFLLLSPMLILFKLGFIKNQKAKEIVLQYFFRNAPVDAFNSKCALFAKNAIPSLIRPAALIALQKHIEDGATVVVVSASPENWVSGWCTAWNIACIATRLKVENNKLTGEIVGKNCYGPEKVSRVKEALDTDAFTEIYAYGDSSGDKEMLAFAHAPHYRYF